MPESEKELAVAWSLNTSLGDAEGATRRDIRSYRMDAETGQWTRVFRMSRWLKLGRLLWRRSGSCAVEYGTPLTTARPLFWRFAWKTRVPFDWMTVEASMAG